MMACSVDDFPAPFGPISPTISPLADLEGETAYRGHGTVPNLEVFDGERGRRHVSSCTALSPR